MKKLLMALLFLMGVAFGAVNINTASKKELISLDGIGNKKAEDIKIKDNIEVK